MKSLSLIPTERIESRIFLLRGKKIMFDSDLAELYGVKTKVFNQVVKRNKKRFPADFMFQLNKQEIEVWQSYFSRSQIVTASKRNVRFAPYVFTEQGVAMLSSVLNSDRAIQVNIQIIRTFTKLWDMMASNKGLREKIEAMEKKYDKRFAKVFEAIRQLLMKDMEIKPKFKIGFRI